MNSSGIVAQSIAGGGGSGGFSGSFTYASGGFPFSDSIRGSGGSGNTAGVVQVASTGNITTQKSNSEGIFAQSVGGGGGKGGFSLTAKVTEDQTTLPPGYDPGIGGKLKGGVGGAGGTGNNVSVQSTGTIMTSGSVQTAFCAVGRRRRRRGRLRDRGRHVGKWGDERQSGRWRGRLGQHGRAGLCAGHALREFLGPRLLRHHAG